MPTQNPILIKRYMFLTSARVILHDELFLDLVRKHTHAYIVGISHHALSVPASVAVKHKKTINIYLDGTIDDIFKCFNDTARNEVRRTFAMSGFSFTMNDGNYTAVYPLYRAFRIAKKLELRPLAFLKPCLLFSAYYNGELISVITCYDVFPYLRIQNIFSKLDNGDKEVRRLTGYATRRLIYEICKYGADHGHILLDMASANFTDPAKAGITQFKGSFGGRVEDEYTYTYRSPFIRFLSIFRRSNLRNMRQLLRI